MKRSVLLVALIGAAILAAGCSSGALSLVEAPTPTPRLTDTPTPASTPTPETCKARAAEFLTNGQRLYDEWQDEAELASHTARFALGLVVEQLQDLRRQWRGLNVPSCADEPHKAMDKYMTLIIDGYLDFMSQDAIASLKFKLAETEPVFVDTAYYTAGLPSPIDPREIEAILTPQN